MKEVLGGQRSAADQSNVNYASFARWNGEFRSNGRAASRSSSIKRRPLVMAFNYRLTGIPGVHWQENR
jgi:hypothetical protein